MESDGPRCIALWDRRVDMVDARPVHIERIGTDVYLLSLGRITREVNWIELVSLAHETAEAVHG